MMLMGTLCDWRNSKGILCWAKTRPETARSRASERINPPSKNVDKMGSTPPLALLLVWRSKNTDLLPNRQPRFLLAFLHLGVSEKNSCRKLFKRLGERLSLRVSML